MDTLRSFFVVKKYRPHGAPRVRVPSHRRQTAWSPLDVHEHERRLPVLLRAIASSSNDATSGSVSQNLPVDGDHAVASAIALRMHDSGAPIRTTTLRLRSRSPNWRCCRRHLLRLRSSRHLLRRRRSVAGPGRARPCRRCRKAPAWPLAASWRVRSARSTGRLRAAATTGHGGLADVGTGATRDAAACAASAAIEGAPASASCDN